MRAANENRLTAFINTDLPSRVGVDSRKSVVLYDQSFRCIYALGSLPDERTLRRLHRETSVRYWSKGV